MEKNYEEYVKRLAEVEAAESKAKDEKAQLNEEYKDIIEEHKAELDAAFEAEQNKFGKSLEGKYFLYCRTFEDVKGFELKALFKLDKFRKFSKNPGPVPVVFSFEGMETMITTKNGITDKLNCHKSTEKMEESINFAISNSAFDSTKEITEEEYKQYREEFSNAFYKA